MYLWPNSLILNQEILGSRKKHMRECSPPHRLSRLLSCFSTRSGFWSPPQLPAHLCHPHTPQNTRWLPVAATLSKFLYLGFQVWLSACCYVSLCFPPSETLLSTVPPAAQSPCPFCLFAFASAMPSRSALFFSLSSAPAALKICLQFALVPPFLGTLLRCNCACHKKGDFGITTTLFGTPKPRPSAELQPGV